MKTIIIALLSVFFFQSINGQGIKSVKMTELEAIIQKSDQPLIVNFWATFCKPCVEEMPYFQSAVAARGGKLGILLVSLDLASFFPLKIENFARKNNITAPIVWLNETNADYFCPRIDSSWSGSIPATLFINPKTGYKKFFEKQLKPEELDAEIAALLK